MSSNITFVTAFPTHMNYRLLKLIAAAKIAGLSYTVNTIDEGVDNMTPEYVNNCHPLSRTPVAQVDEGYLFESDAILRHIARIDKSNSFLYGRTAYEASQVDMWIDYCNTELLPPAIRLFFAKDEAATAATVEINTALQGLETWLEIRTFLVGERLTIADLVLGFSLEALWRMAPDHEVFTKKFRNVFRFQQTVINQPKCVEALNLYNSAIGFVKVEKKKEEKKAEPKKKEEKPKKKEADEDEDLLEEPQEKKKPNPLDLLPPSAFVLDAFKREYSNKDTRKEAAPFLFSNFDPEGFSAFWCKYKYNDELEKGFMTSNLVRGWFQRMDHVRKYAFSSVLICGEDAKHEIVGFWIFRGKGIPQIVLDVDDTDLYSWTEIKDIKAEADKITDYLAWDGETFKAQPVLDGRVFK